MEYVYILFVFSIFLNILFNFEQNDAEDKWV